MQVVRHENDVVDDSSDSIDGKCLEVPERRWRCNRHRLIVADVIFQERKELEVVEAIALFSNDLTVNLDVRCLEMIIIR